MKKNLFAVLLTMLVTALGLTAVVQPAQASAAVGAGVHDGKIVSADPENWTPNVNDGKVLEIVEVGDQVIVGGRFTSVSQKANSTPIPVDGLFGFEFGSGTISDFRPSIDGEARAIIAGPKPGTVFVSGTFKNINGKAIRLALLDARTGEFVPGFNAAAVNGPVQDLAIYGDQLLVGGTFTYVGGKPRAGFASLDVNTGSLTDFGTLDFTGHHSWTEGSTGSKGGVGIRSMDVFGDKMITIGNFSDVSGSARQQITMIDLAGGASVSQAWNTTAFADACSKSFDSWVRDVEFAPDGQTFAVSTTGGPYLDTMCDTASQWSVADATDARAEWINATGGDTLWGVSVSDSTVYTGGHQRWMNNIDGRDNPEPGAVPRPGIGAMDQKSGANVSWNPGRHPRGVAAFAISATDRGLWVGSDTESIGVGDTYELRKRIAFFSKDTGTPAGTGAVPELPAYLTVIGDSNGDITRSLFDGTDVGAAEQMALGTLDPAKVRTAFRADDWLYYGMDDGLLYRRAVDRDGVSDKEEVVDPYNDPVWSDVALPGGITFRGEQPEIYAMLASGEARGLSYFDGRLYFTLSGDNTVYHTGFAPESGIIEPFRGPDPVRSLGGALQSPEDLVVRSGAVYYVNGSTGDLMMATWDGTDLGDSVIISGSADGRDWRGSALYLDDGPDTLPNLDPVADFTSDCSGVDCTLDATASDDPDGTIDSYEWDLGDGNTATGVQVAHTYATEGEYQVTLTVTDNDGGQDSKTRTLRAVEGGISYIGASAIAKNVKNLSLAIPGKAAPGDLAVAVVTQNSTSGYSLGSGWTVQGEKVTSSSRMIVATASVADVSALDLSLDSWSKVAAHVLIYRGVDPTTPVGDIAMTKASKVSSMASPKLTAAGGQWAVFAWGAKSSVITDITAPTEVTPRSVKIGTGGGATSGLMADSSGQDVGPVGGQVAVFDALAGKAHAATVLLNVASGPPPNVDPVADFTASCTDLTCDFDASGSSDSDGNVTGYDWDFGDGATAAGVTTSHTFAQAGTYPVTLTVTDDAGGTGVVTKKVRLGQVNIELVGKKSFNGSVKAFKVGLPNGTADGDIAIVTMTHNSTKNYTLAPEWTLAAEKLTASSRMIVAYAPVSAVTAFEGSIDEWNKADIQLLVYRGLDSAAPIDAVKFLKAASVTKLKAPQVTADGSQWVLNAWGVKSAVVTDITEEAGSVVRGKRIGSGGGAISALIIDSDGLVDGPVGDSTATFTGTAARVIATTVLLNGAS